MPLDKDLKKEIVEEYKRSENTRDHLSSGGVDHQACQRLNRALEGSRS